MRELIRTQLRTIAETAENCFMTRKEKIMNRYVARFNPAHVDIKVPNDLNTEELRAWIIRKIDEIDIQRKKYQQILQRYSNTGHGKKQYTPEEMAVIRTERDVLHEQRNAYRTLLGDINAANKELSQQSNNQKRSRQFSEVFVEAAKAMLSAQDFNRVFNETINRTTTADHDEEGKIVA